MKYIDFNAKTDVVLCLNSVLSEAEAFAKFENIPILAADGAANRLIDMGIVPDVVIGDLDSFDKEKYASALEGRELIHIADQNSNDFEKCLEYAISKKWTNIMLLGVAGGRLEHTIANWSVIKKYSKRVKLLVLENARYSLVLSSGEYTLKAKPRETISLVPHCHCNIKTQGLKWNLNDEVLAIGLREGHANIAEQEDIHLHINDGEVMVVMDARLPHFYSLT